MTTEHTASAEPTPTPHRTRGVSRRRRRGMAAVPPRRAGHRAHRGAGVLPRQDLPGPLVLHPVRVDGRHAARERPDPRGRDHSAVHRLRPRRDRRVPRSRGLASAIGSRASPADHRSASTGCCPSSGSPPPTATITWSSASSACPATTSCAATRSVRSPSTTCRSTRPTTSSSRPARQRHPATRSMSWFPRTGSGCSATTATARRTRATTRTSRARASCPIENVVGRAFLITWPLERFGVLELPPRGVRGRPARPRRDAQGAAAP